MVATRARVRTLWHYFKYKYRGVHGFVLQAQMAEARPRLRRQCGPGDGLLGIPSKTAKEERIDFARGADGVNKGPGKDSWPSFNYNQRGAH